MTSPFRRFCRFILRCILFLPALILKLSVRLCLRIFKFIHDCFGSDRPISDPYENPAQATIFMIVTSFLGTFLWFIYVSSNIDTCGFFAVTYYSWCEPEWHVSLLILHAILMIIMYFSLAYIVIGGLFIGILLGLALAKNAIERFVELVKDIVENRNRGQQPQQPEQAEAGNEPETDPLIQVESTDVDQEEYDTIDSLV